MEYDCCVVAQYPIASAELTGAHLELQLGQKQTACLANARRETEAACACC